MTLMKYPHGASPELKRLLKGILTGLSAKSELLVPEGVEVELIEATRSGTASFQDALQYHDNAISRGMLVVALLGMGGSDVTRGADSQSRLQLRVLFKMGDDLAKDLMRTFHDQVIKPLVDLNFEHTDLYPTFIWQEYGEFEGFEVADTIRLLHAAGMIDMDQEDVNYARSILGLPLRKEGDPEDDVVRPQPLPPQSSISVPLGTIAGARSGDKGGNANVGVWVRTDEQWKWLAHTLTVEMLKELLPEAADLNVTRYQLPHLRAVNFVIEGILGQGVASQARFDPQAKGIGEWLRSRHIDIPISLLPATDEKEDSR